MAGYWRCDNSLWLPPVIVVGDAMSVVVDLFDLFSVFSSAVEQLDEDLKLKKTDESHDMDK